MSVQKLKSTILQLERKRNKRRLAVRRLQEEHDQLLLHCKAMDLLVQHQDIVVRMLHRYFQPCCSPPSSIEDDTGFITPLLHDCPQLAGFEAMRLADYNWLLSATAQQVGTRCFHHLQRIAMVMNQRKASSSSNSSSSSGGGGGNVSQQQQADMDEAVSELLLLTKAMYILTPGIVYALKDVNLMTMQLEPPPDSHWERAFCATEASLEQLQLFEAVLQQVVPRMQQLEEDRQELAACINSVKALTLKEQCAHAVAAAQQLVQQQENEQQQQQQQQRQKQETKGRVARAAAEQREKPQQQQQQKQKQRRRQQR
ncbi:hypothetical protein OEZ86_004228 [Tetradesmus obliquus]|nr:hypothetical protein OEZ86_004228 [Tetradesmus obliquus]